MDCRVERVPDTTPEEKAEPALPRMLETERRLGPVLYSRSVGELWLEARSAVAIPIPMVVSDHTRMSASELMELSPPPSRLVMERM
jgi:hypothetical protein